MRRPASTVMLNKILLYGVRFLFITFFKGITILPIFWIDRPVHRAPVRPDPGACLKEIMPMYKHGTDILKKTIIRRMKDA